MKTTLLFSLVFFVVPLQDDTDILGTWTMSENDTEIEIEKEGEVYTGTVISSDLEEAVGKEILRDFKQEGETWKGKFYVVRRDRAVDATLKQVDDMLELEIVGPRRSKTVNLSRTE